MMTLIGRFRAILSVCVWLNPLVPWCLAGTADTASALHSAMHGTGQDRYTAIDDLGELHRSAAEVVPQLQQLLANKDSQVRWRSARALGDYGDRAQSAAAELRKL